MTTTQDPGAETTPQKSPLEIALQELAEEVHAELLDGTLDGVQLSEFIGYMRGMLDASRAIRAREAAHARTA